MRVFLDFEASSTSRHSYPIEVAWVFEDGAGEQHLIRPAPGWDDWEAEAEAIHGIARATLVAEGTPHEVVAARMMAALSGHRLFASAPSWDGKWLSRLLRAAGLPRHALRLSDTEVAQGEAVEAVLAGRGAGGEGRATALVRQTKLELEARHVAHRALADAERERRIMLQAEGTARFWPGA